MSQPRSSSEQPHTTVPVEMGNITSPEQEPATAITTSETQPQQTTTSDYTTTTTQASSQPAQSAATRSDDLPTIAMPPPAITRQETEAIGPSTDLPTPSLGPSESTLQQGPVVIINLLLTSTGARHPYKIDEKYLNKRGVTAEGEGGAFDPFVISVYTLKELIWRDWRAGMYTCELLEVGKALTPVACRVGNQAFIAVCHSPHPLRSPLGG